ncbi:MAG: Crp/Fnr family transcriptional regulator [Sphaerochaetaceae bacterium]
MKNYDDLLLNSPLFSELTRGELCHILNCLKAKQRKFSSQEFIIRESEQLEHVGVVLEGRVQILTDDALGNRSINLKLGAGELFGHVAATKLATVSPVSVMSEGETTILFLNFHNLVAPCSNACNFHARVIENMMNVLAERNLMMNRKLSILSKRSIREKLLAYLTWQSHDSGSQEFSIPFNRDELADYLSVNRSALSRELSKMIGEGYFHNERNHFKLNNKVLASH